MFAIIKTGGKQYKVAKGDKIWVEKLDATAGEKVSITDVLMLNDGKDVKVGAPLVDKAQVQFTVVDQTRDDKVIVFKKKRRQNYRRKHGHRQHKTVLMVEDISLGGKSSAAPAAKKTEAAEKPAPKKADAKKDAAPAAAKKPAAKKPAAKKPTDKK